MLAVPLLMWQNVSRGSKKNKRNILITAYIHLFPQMRVLICEHFISLTLKTPVLTISLNVNIIPPFKHHV